MPPHVTRIRLRQAIDDLVAITPIDGPDIFDRLAAPVVRSPSENENWTAFLDLKQVGLPLIH
jgi:hypothetical protein